MHSFRGRGDARPRLLYWYRTPPDVKVGRAALDEEAIRALEESNSELTFDWSRILHSRATPQPGDRPPGRRSERAAGGRPRREREAVRQAAPPSAPAVQPATPAVQPARLPEPRPSEPPPPGRHPPETGRGKGRRRRRPPKRGEAARLPFPDEARPAAATVGPTELVDEGGPAPQEAGEVPPEVATRGSALETIRRDDLARLRARYAEIQARITQQVTDPQRLERLRALAEQLNPDAWVTAEEVAAGLAEFESVHGALREMVGRRRRRSRRGGVRHRRGGHQPAAGESVAPPAPDGSPSEQPGDNSGAADDSSTDDAADEE
jgi:hypothetical protein